MVLVSFSEFLSMTYPFLNGGKKKTDYVVHLCSLFINDEIEDSYSDLSSPFQRRNGQSKKQDRPIFTIPTMSQTSLRALFNGSDPLSAENASYIIGNWDQANFIDEIQYLHPTPMKELFRRFEKLGVDVADEYAPDHIAEYFFKILLAAENNEESRRGFVSDSVPVFNDAVPLRLAEINSSACSYDSTTRILTIGNRQIKIAPALIPNVVEADEISSRYLKALFEVFAECLKKESISIEELKEKSPFLYALLLDNRTYFYNAECIRHVIRDSFVDGATYFGDYEDEVYEGVIEEYRKSYPCGYDRLLSVLSKSSSINLENSKIEKLCLIGLKEKKGVCHILVEEGRIKSWVKLF